jgi:transposase
MNAADAPWFTVEVLVMQLITILNRCHRFRGFVYECAKFSPSEQPHTIEVRVRPRAGSAAICSGCHRPAAGYDHLSERRFEFIPFWGFLVFLLYRMRRVNCKTCGVVVEELPWASGKHQLTKVYMQFLAHWLHHFVLLGNRSATPWSTW